jgi:hypothetical protein
MTGQLSNGPQFYEIQFRGHLDPSRAQMFEGLEMVQEASGDTVLTGRLVDQAALHGVLNRIRDLGLPLLAVRQVADSEAGGEG